jgi:tRNA (mo5U34)-methyltransferase
MADELARAIASVRWFHQIDLGPYGVTPGADNSPQRLSRMAFPRDLRGKRVLDVGAWDGFYSFEAEKRGAAHVLATDSFAWDGRNWSDQTGFQLAHRLLGSKVQSKLIDPLDLAPDAVGGTYDVVLFLGVLYHMKHPLLALERIASVTGDLLIIETEVDNLLVPSPSLAFYPATELNDDPSNWFGPNAKAVEGMLRAVGFKRVETIWRSSFARRVARAVKMRVQGGHPLLRGLGRDRMTWHAYKS